MIVPDEAAKFRKSQVKLPVFRLSVSDCSGQNDHTHRAEKKNKLTLFQERGFLKNAAPLAAYIALHKRIYDHDSFVIIADQYAMQYVFNDWGGFDR